MELPPGARVEDERKISSDAQQTTQKIAAAVSVCCQWFLLWYIDACTKTLVSLLWMRKRPLRCDLHDNLLLIQILKILRIGLNFSILRKIGQK